MKKIKKLTLKKETISFLTKNEMNQEKGGTDSLLHPVCLSWLKDAVSGNSCDSCNCSQPTNCYDCFSVGYDWCMNVPYTGFNVCDSNNFWC